MPAFLRMIQEKYWYSSVDWLGPGELPADVFSDLRTEDGNLSVFEVSDGMDADRIVVAVAVGRDPTEDKDYVLLDGTLLDSLGLEVEQTPGETPDQGVNQAHRHISRLTTYKLAALADTISGIEPDSLLKADVDDGILEGVRRHDLDPWHVNFHRRIRGRLDLPQALESG